MSSQFLPTWCLLLGLNVSFAFGVAPAGKLVPEAVQVDSIGATKIMRSEHGHAEAVEFVQEQVAPAQSQPARAPYIVYFKVPGTTSGATNCLTAECGASTSPTSCTLGLTPCSATSNSFTPTATQVFWVTSFVDQGANVGSSVNLTTSMIYFNNNGTLAQPMCLSPPLNGNDPVNVEGMTSASDKIHWYPCCYSSQGSYAQMWRYIYDNRQGNAEISGPGYQLKFQGAPGSSRGICLTYGDTVTGAASGVHLYDCTASWDFPTANTLATQQFMLKPATGSFSQSTVGCV